MCGFLRKKNLQSLSSSVRLLFYNGQSAVCSLNSAISLPYHRSRPPLPRHVVWVVVWVYYTIVVTVWVYSYCGIICWCIHYRSEFTDLWQRRYSALQRRWYSSIGQSIRRHRHTVICGLNSLTNTPNLWNVAWTNNW